MLITFSSPRAQPEVNTFYGANESPYFLIITLKFQLQIHYTLEVIAEYLFPVIQILNFLVCIFITASSPVSHTCPRRENKK